MGADAAGVDAAAPAADSSPAATDTLVNAAIVTAAAKRHKDVEERGLVIAILQCAAGFVGRFCGIQNSQAAGNKVVTAYGICS